MTGHPPGTPLTPELARQVAMSMIEPVCPLVVYATLTHPGDEYVLSVRLEQVSSEQLRSPKYQAWTRSFSGVGQPVVFSMIHDASLWIRDMSGETSVELYGQNRSPAETSSASWPALARYAQGDALATAGRAGDAVRFFNEAADIAPGFVAAYSRLGEQLYRVGAYDDAYKIWRRGIVQADRRELITRDTLRLRGRYFEDMGDLAEAERTYRSYTVHYPDDFDASFFLANLLVDLNRPAEAASWFERARDMRPTLLNVWIRLTLAYLDTGHLDRATECIDRMNKLPFGREWAQWLRALATFSEANVRSALAVLEPLRTSTDRQWHSRASAIRASWLSEIGDDERALEELQAGIGFDAGHGLRESEADKWLSLAALQLRTGHRDAVVATSQRALDLAAIPRRVAIAGELAAQAGDLAQARTRMAALDRYVDASKVAAFKDRIQCEILLAEGRAADAVAIFTRLLALRPRRQYRQSFARALVKTGNLPTAENVIREDALHPIRLYMNPEPELPGHWRQAVLQLIALVERRDAAGATELRAGYRGLLQPSPDTP